MSALDQAFLKAYSQHSPALAPTAVKPVVTSGAPQNPTPNTASAEVLPSPVAMPGAGKVVQQVTPTKATSKRTKGKAKTPAKSPTDTIFEAMGRIDAPEAPAAKPRAANKTPSARRAKKTATPTSHLPRAAREKTERKPKSKSETTAAAPRAPGRTAPEAIYRLDLPAASTAGGVSAGARPPLPAPHTNVIFSAREPASPQREPTPSRDSLAGAEASSSKNLASRPAEIMPAVKTAAANAMPADAPSTPPQNQRSKSNSDGWTGDFTRALSNLDGHAPTGSQADPPREREIAKNATGNFAPPAIGVKQSAAAPMRLSAAERESPWGKNTHAEIAGTSGEKAAAPDTPAPAIRLFQPMLQVDHFAWPKVCGRLESSASSELDRVIETLTAAQIRGKKVFALGGCHSGDGASSLLLATARRLAAQGMKVALVEADWTQPQLARRLGLLPQYGWEDVLAGRLPLEEVLIESIAEHLVVLPVREPFGVAELPAEAANRLADTWNSLRRNFDIVLADPGPLANSPILDGQLVGVMGGRIDATVLVKNLHQHNASEFDAATRALNDAGAKVLGVVENFTE